MVLRAAARLTLFLLLPELGVQVALPGSSWLCLAIQPARRALAGIGLWHEAEWEVQAAESRAATAAAA